MNIYCQVLSQLRTPDVIRLLLIPAALHVEQAGCQLRVSAGGKIRTSSFESIEKAVEHIHAAKFNQLEVTYLFSKAGKSRVTGGIVSVVGVFTPSPSSELWFKSESWPVGGERAMRNRKLNAKAAELALSNYNIALKPSVFEVAIQIRTKESQDRILDTFAEWLADFMPKTLGPLAVFGCMDVGGPEFFVKLESNVLMTSHIRMMARLLPTVYPELGQRFDALHPVMFGSKKVCDGIGSALGKDARVIPIDASSDSAVVRVKRNAESVSAKDPVFAWLLPPAVFPIGVPPKS